MTEWFEMKDAPRHEPIIALVSGEEIEIEWAETRRCMLAGIGGGNGYFSEGWQDVENRLILMDEPEKWKPKAGSSEGGK